jgi:hypothetical protein
MREFLIKIFMINSSLIHLFPNPSITKLTQAWKKFKLILFFFFGTKFSICLDKRVWKIQLNKTVGKFCWFSLYLSCFYILRKKGEKGENSE